MELTMIQNNLPSGYQRDLQLLKESFVPAISTLKSCIDMAIFMLENIKVSDNLLEDERYLYIFSVEEVNKMVINGIPFRDAYKKVGRDIMEGNFCPEKKVCHTHIGSVGNLRNDMIHEKMDRAINDK
jgi:argininosuccinate lyase